MKTCAVIAGADQRRIPDQMFLASLLKSLYYDFGVKKIIAGVHRGAELSALDFILKQKEDFPGLFVGGVFIHEEESSGWRENEREQLFRLISRCDEEWILHPFHGGEMRFQRNIMMMDRSDIVFLLGRDGETEFWAAKTKKPMLRSEMKPWRVVPDLRLYRKEE